MWDLRPSSSKLQCGGVFDPCVFEEENILEIHEQGLKCRIQGDSKDPWCQINLDIIRLQVGSKLFFWAFRRNEADSKDKHVTNPANRGPCAGISKK